MNACYCMHHHCTCMWCWKTHSNTCWTEITPLKSFHPSYIKMALFTPYFTEHAQRSPQWTFIRGKVSLTDWSSVQRYKVCSKYRQNDIKKTKKKKQTHSFWQDELRYTHEPMLLVGDSCDVEFEKYGDAGYRVHVKYQFKSASVWSEGV